jgi:tripeptidyl-peptidase I
LFSSGAFDCDYPKIELTVWQTVAGVISLLNDYLISKGKSSLGFLNPWIYSKASTCFNDITSGNNPGCNTQGFSAVQGWDPVSSVI